MLMNVIRQVTDYIKINLSINELLSWILKSKTLLINHLSEVLEQFFKYLIKFIADLVTFSNCV